MVDTFYDGHYELYHHAKFGEIEQRASAVGSKIWCLYVFCCCNSVMLQGRRAVRLRVTYFEQVLCRGLWVDFDTVYIVFQH